MGKPNFQTSTIYRNDNLDVLQGMDDETVDLIYLDPPFNKNKEFASPISNKAINVEPHIYEKLTRNERELLKEMNDNPEASFDDIFGDEDIKLQALIEISAHNQKLYWFLESFKNIGDSSNFCYLVYMAERLMEMHRVLKPTGSIYLHCDPTMHHYLKIIMDCIFGESNFRNEIIWRIGWLSGYKTKKRGWIRNHENILYYVMSNEAAKKFNKEYIPYASDYVRRDGKKPTGEGVPIEDTWNCSETDKLDSIQIKSFDKEKTGYPTQKPLALLRRIIKASSSEGDIVLDPFCGCATTCVAAEQLGRKWVGIDISDKAFLLTRIRLLKEKHGDNQQTRMDFSDEAILSSGVPQRTKDKVKSKPKGYVYVASNINEPGLYKVGRTSGSPEERAKSELTFHIKRDIRIEYSLLTENYKRIEKSVHVHYKSQGKIILHESGRSSEWVKADLHEIKSLIDKFEAEAKAEEQG